MVIVGSRPPVEDAAAPVRAASGDGAVLHRQHPGVPYAAAAATKDGPGSAPLRRVHQDSAVDHRQATLTVRNATTEMGQIMGYCAVYQRQGPFTPDPTALVTQQRRIVGPASTIIARGAPGHGAVRECQRPLVPNASPVLIGFASVGHREPDQLSRHTTGHGEHTVALLPVHREIASTVQRDVAIDHNLVASDDRRRAIAVEGVESEALVDGRPDAALATGAQVCDALDVWTAPRASTTRKQKGAERRNTPESC